MRHDIGVKPIIDDFMAIFGKSPQKYIQILFTSSYLNARKSVPKVSTGKYRRNNT